MSLRCPLSPQESPPGPPLRHLHGEPMPAADTAEVVTHPIARLAGGALAVRRGTRTWIVVDPELDPAARRAAVTHERVHLDRGALLPARHLPAGWAAVVAREERIVDAEVARRLVPPDELAHAISRWQAGDEAVTATLVALAFDTTVEVAATALDLARCRLARCRVTQSAGSPSRNDDIADHQASGASNWGL